jgi:hypothetical protein
MEPIPASGLWPQQYEEVSDQEAASDPFPGNITSPTLPNVIQHLLYFVVFGMFDLKIHSEYAIFCLKDLIQPVFRHFFWGGGVISLVVVVRRSFRLTSAMGL